VWRGILVFIVLTRIFRIWDEQRKCIKLHQEGLHEVFTFYPIMLLNYTTRDEMVHIFSKHESKDRCSRMGRRPCKLNGQAGGRGMFWLICTLITFVECTDLSKRQTAAIRQGTARLVACLLRGDSEAEGEAIVSPAFTAWFLPVIFRAGALPPVLLDIGGNPDVPHPIPEKLFFLNRPLFAISCFLYSFISMSLPGQDRSSATTIPNLTLC
jgi:hypothetical protein